MGVLKDVSARGFNAHGVRNGELIEQCSDRFEEGRGEKLFVLGCQRRYKPNVHNTIPCLAVGCLASASKKPRDDFAIGVPRCATRESNKTGQFLSIHLRMATLGAQKLCERADFLHYIPATPRIARAHLPQYRM